ncbi:MAG TPA: tripartite tricarboxylate transporter permease, partial [Candidatus Ozemobacteraceae bacterium]|nr:tripartite tricarboxylate transporter permease [Candidatus Ozemobacteraceae bacterium]
MSWWEAFFHPQYLDLVWFCLVGVISSCLFSFLPALHIYNVIGIFMWFMLQFESMLEPMQLVAICMGMIVGYSILNTVPSTFFSPGDESLSYYVLPGAQWLAQGKGWEAVMLTGMGAVGGLVVLALLAPLLISILPGLRAITAPHMFWIIGAVISFMVLSEWPKGTSQSPSCWANLWEGWKYLGVGLITFVLAALLGFIVTSRTFVPVEFAFQSITPVFVGLFALPWLITNLICLGRIPRQHVSESVDLDWELFARGTFSGFLGGFTAAYVPIVTAGVGGLMSGHGTAQRDSRLFVMSFGTCK